mgnify:CR=1 FL=1
MKLLLNVSIAIKSDVSIFVQQGGVDLRSKRHQTVPFITIFETHIQ